jgi:hypothetical protein
VYDIDAEALSLIVKDERAPAERGLASSSRG